MVDSFQVWYGQAIRNNKGDVERMSSETMAILLHYSEKADHSLCPKGKDSWCKWQIDLATGENTYTPVSNPLAPAVVEAIKPVFDALSSEKLLQGCSKCLTQNQNESLHNTVWRFVPKDQFHSKPEVEVGIRLGILKFNSGITKMSKTVYSACGINYTKNMEKQFQIMDKRRVYKSRKEEKEDVKAKRKMKRQRRKRKIDGFRHKEGQTYKSGAFHNFKPTAKRISLPKCKTCGNPRKGHSRGKCHSNT